MKTFKQIGTGLAALGLMFAAAAPAVADEVKTKGGLEVESDSGDFSFEFGGRIMVDAAFFDEDVTPLHDGTEFRRARLFAEGKLFKNWEYKAQYDFADDSLSMKDAYIRYKGFSAGDITIGQFKMPFSLEELTSSKYITFMERSLPNAFATGRRIGVGFNRNNDRSTFAVAVYGQEAGNEDSALGDEGTGIGARFTYLPLKTDDSLFHIGIAAAIEESAGDLDRTFRFRERPEAHLANSRLVDTGSFGPVSDLTKYGLELAYVKGPFSVQGEYIVADVSQQGGLPSVDFDGYYVYASWFPGGQSRPYKKGAFSRVKPGDDGAWEIGLRYSALDLNDTSGGIYGGEQNDITVGVNYYVNKNLRFMGNYILVDAEQTDPLTGIVTSDQPNILQFRAQIDF